MTSKNCKRGLQVYRGKDWDRDWADDYGYVKKCLEFKWANVKWSRGILERYRIGNSGKHDLCILNRQIEHARIGLLFQMYL